VLFYALGSAAGWIAVALCVFLVALPYCLRCTQIQRRWLWPHFWAAYLTGGLTMVHVGTVMRTMGHANVAGVWFARGAFLLLGFEIALGLAVRESGGRGRGLLRRIHFWIGVGFTCLLTAHLWLNA
jgi:hypothetical protein